MSLIQRLFKRSSPEPTTPAYDTYYDRLTGFPGVAGVDVNTTTAEGISAVYACVAAISETVGSLPLDVYRNTDNGREKAKSHPLYRLLHDAPNNYQTALEFREQMQRHVLLRGNAYAEIVWNPNGSVKALLPMHPDSVTVLRSSLGNLVYEHVDGKGNQRRLLADEVLHLRYHSDDGILGRSPIQVARDTIGLALQSVPTAPRCSSKAPSYRASSRRHPAPRKNRPARSARAGPLVKPVSPTTARPPYCRKARRSRP